MAMKQTVLVLLVLAVVFGLASAVPSSRGVDRALLEHGRPLPLPAGWSRVSAAPVNKDSSREIDLLFAVKQRNLDALEEAFWAVSIPSDPRYGKHFNLDQLAELIAPSEDSVNTLIDWLNDEGIYGVSVTQARDFLRVSVSAETASRVFGVDFHTYKHRSGVTSDVAVGPYSVPLHVAPHLDLVSGLVGFPTIHKRRPKFAPRTADVAITPDVIRARYNITDTIVTPNPNNAQAVAEFQAQYYSASDLKSFWGQFVTNAPYQDVAKIIGQNTPGEPGEEASLDVQYLMGVAPNISTWFYSLKSFNFWHDLLKWSAEIANETSPPWVHSVSYGEQGNYPSESYRARLSVEFQKAGVRGISIIFASGDSGSGCLGTDSASTCQCTLYPSFPATSPYITSVGATAFISGNSGPEKAVMRGGIEYKSGGGFSQEFPADDIQSIFTASYLNRTDIRFPSPCSYNASNRGTPDVSALGDIQFQIVVGGEVSSIGGTSASAPTYSAIISLLNEKRLNENKPTLGFLNPWIYLTAGVVPSAYYDVTQGNNIFKDCCPSGLQGGFETSVGWDPVTGVGSPNYEVLAALV